MVADTPTFVEQGWSFDFDFGESCLVCKVNGTSHMVGMCSIAFLNKFDGVLHIDQEVICWVGEESSL